MGSPSECADDAAGIAAYGKKRRIEHGAADGVVHDVEAVAVRILLDVHFDRRLAIDCGRAKPSKEPQFRWARGCENGCAARKRELNDNVTDTAGTTVNEHRIARPRVCAIDETFPRGDERKR